MIFGLLSEDGSESPKNQSANFSLLRYIEFPDNEVETIVFNSGFVHLLHHPNLPDSQRDQCFTSDDLSVILSGHIYNETELLKKSETSSKSTAEIIANQYKKHGIKSIESINGDHAIVLIDHSKSAVYFVKNQLGTVPLSVAQKDGVLFFSSDTIGLSKTLFGKDKINLDYIKSRFIDYEGNYDYTPHSKVKKVLPGHYVQFTNEGLNTIKYWPTEPIIDINPTFEEATIELEKLLNHAIDIRINEEYTIGSHISGGVDSSLIAHLARTKTKHQDEFVGFTWSPKKFESKTKINFDERDNILKQAAFSGIDIEYTDITKDDYDDFVKEWRCPSEFIYEKTVFENAKRSNVNVIFSGWGGDEFLGVRDEGLTYESFMKLRWKDFFKLNRKKGIKSKVMHFFNSIVVPTRHKIYYTLKINPYVFKFFKKSSLTNRNKDFTKKWYKTKTGYQLSLLDYYHLAQRCEDRYVHGQRNGIEYRYPLLDKNLVEYCLSLPVHLFVGSPLDRPLIRELAKNHLVDEIRLLMKQTDPVVMANSIQIQNEAIQEYKKELDLYRANDYLSFVDFDALAEEITKSDAHKDTINKKLNYLLHQIKSTHEFTTHYTS